MIKVAGMWERGWTAPIMEIEQWRFMLREYNIEEFIMTPVSGIADDFVTEYETLEQAIDANPDLTVVHVDADADVNLEDFNHPENALYLFGSANHDTDFCKEDGHLSVKIPTINNQAGFWPHQAASIILNDRFLKSR
jgi:hypothetical protein